MSKKKFHLWNVCLGNLFEHYDTALFGFLSPFLAPLIFPGQDPLTALLLTYAIIPFGMFARPLGSLVFGYIGDVYGRNRALSLTLTGMAFVSGGMALIPSYTYIGVLAPILFCLGRALQNFLSGGESVGGAIFLLENAPEEKHDMLSSLYNVSTIGGYLLASFGVYILSQSMQVNPGWRLLYAFGCITALFGCLMRRQTYPSPAPMKVSQSFFSFRKTVWTHRKPFLCIVITAGFSYATYSIAFILLNGFIPLVSPLTKTEMMAINSYLLIFDFCALPFFGYLSSKISREIVMLVSALGTTLLAIPLCMCLEGAPLPSIIGIRVCFVIAGVAFCAPFHAWAQQLIPPEHRYTVISFGYAIGSQVIGGPTAAISLWCFQQTKIVASVSWYWVVLAMASSVAVAITMRAKKPVLGEVP